MEKHPPVQSIPPIPPSIDDKLAKEKEEVYIMALHDMCARYEVTISAIINLAADISNTKNYYLKLIGQMRQEKEKAAMGEPISSK